MVRSLRFCPRLVSTHEPAIRKIEGLINSNGDLDRKLRPKNIGRRFYVNGGEFNAMAKSFEDRNAT
jgi:hypothetical protein